LIRKLSHYKLIGVVNIKNYILSLTKWALLIMSHVRILINKNGSAERKHRHIVEVGLPLLAQASMPLKFWDEAFLTTTYLINRTPNRVLNFSTPLQKLEGGNPNYSFLRVFGCACWSNLRPYNKHKIQFRSKECTFLGYSTMHKGTSVFILKLVVFTSPVMFL
jgi:histone deacetylase 1/2